MKMRHLNTKMVIFLAIVIVIFASFLRLYKLDSIPSSLYWEEAALGYDAFSIAQTGKDHHGNSFPFVAFTSFGDYKPSGYFYAVVPFIKLLGLSEWSVRLPSATSGVATVVGIGFLVHYLSKSLWPLTSDRFHRLSFLVGLVVAATSPWLIQFSRGGWEANLATSLLLWSVLLGLWSLSDVSSKYLKIFVSCALTALSMYVYHATRVIAPAVLLAVFILWILPSLETSKFHISRLFDAIKKVLLPGCFFLFLVAPLIFSSRDVSTQQRFAETSLTSDGQYVIASNRFRAMAGENLVSSIFTHRYLILGQEVSAAFLSHFSADFLFVSGDNNPRHSTGFTGIMLLTDLAWIVAAVVPLADASRKSIKARKLTIFMAWWLCIGILPAALTKAYPHALRILPVAPVFLTVISIGILQILIWLKKLLSPKVFMVSLVAIGLVVTGFWLNYWRFYTNIYPITSQVYWQYGYKQMVSMLNQAISQHAEASVFVTREYGRPAMYYWFYSSTNPGDVQNADSAAMKDQEEFLSFKNISFINTVNEAKPGIVASSEQGFNQLKKQFSSVEKISDVRDSRDHVVWVISRVGPQ